MPTGITVFLPAGEPNGIKIVGLSGWSGKAYVIPRAKLKEARERTEVNAPAVYFLFGEGENPSRPHVYIGESENCYNRLLNHADNKEFWNLAFVFIGADLDRADVKYLENQAVGLAKKLDRYEIENQIEPLKNRLTEFKKAADDDFFTKVQFVMALFGHALFQGVPKQQTATELYHFKTSGAEATGTILETGEFLVYAGSTARIKDTPSFKGSGPALRSRLLNQKVLVPQDEHLYIFRVDHIFTSPSAASDTVAARGSNGWVGWKDAEGKTLDENVRK